MDEEKLTERLRKTQQEVRELKDSLNSLRIAVRNLLMLQAAPALTVKDKTVLVTRTRELIELSKNN